MELIVFYGSDIASVEAYKREGLEYDDLCDPYYVRAIVDIRQESVHGSSLCSCLPCNLNSSKKTLSSSMASGALA